MHPPCKAPDGSPICRLAGVVLHPEDASLASQRCSASSAAVRLAVFLRCGRCRRRAGSLVAQQRGCSRLGGVQAPVGPADKGKGSVGALATAEARSRHASSAALQPAQPRAPKRPARHAAPPRAVFGRAPKRHDLEQGCYAAARLAAAAAALAAARLAAVDGAGLLHRHQGQLQGSAAAEIWICSRRLCSLHSSSAAGWRCLQRRLLGRRPCSRAALPGQQVAFRLLLPCRTAWLAFQRLRPLWQRRQKRGGVRWGGAAPPHAAAASASSLSCHAHDSPTCCSCRSRAAAMSVRL